MPDNYAAGKVDHRKNNNLTAAELRDYDANSMHDAVTEELAELCESPGDLGCADEINNMPDNGRKIGQKVEEEPNPIFSEPDRKG